MADKTALNTGYTYYADIVFACGFTDATGNFTELVTDTQIGVVSGTTSRSSDGTHGEFVSLESDDSEVNFGDNANWDGFANFTCMGLAQNDATSIPGGAQDSQYLFAKTGSGQDAFSALWQNSENWAGLVDTGSDVFASITDGLDDGTSGEVATNWNLLGLTYDGSDAYIRANESSSSASQTGSINATGHDLLLGNDTTGARGWLGNVAMFVILDIALSSAEWADIVADPTGEIFASGGTDVSVGTASLAVTTYAASITHDRNVAAATASLAVSTAAATVGLDTNVSANTTALSVATNAAAITYDVNVTAGPETLAVTTNAATIGYDVEVNVGTAALAVATNQATISAGVNVQANAAALAVSAFQATITYDVEVNAGTAGLTVTTNQATIAAGDSIDVQTAALALTTYPALIQGDHGTVSRVVALTAVFDPGVTLTGTFDPGTELTGTFDTGVSLDGQADGT